MYSIHWDDLLLYIIYLEQILSYNQPLQYLTRVMVGFGKATYSSLSKFLLSSELKKSTQGNMHIAAILHNSHQIQTTIQSQQASTPETFPI